MAAHISPSSLIQVEHIRIADVDSGGWDILLDHLGADEQARAARFAFARDRQAYIAGHALLRDMLARHGGPHARDWRFVTGPHGKPEPVRPAGAPDLRINLSHTRGLAVVALTEGADVGVDVEWMSRDNDLGKIASRFFAPDECRQLDAAAREHRRDLFFALWTLKEAYLKATGFGLSMPLTDFAFDLADTSIAFAPHVADDPQDWCFWRRPLLDAYALAVAVRRPRAAPPALAVAPADLGRLLGR